MKPKLSELSGTILNFMREEAYQPLTAEDLARQMDIRGKELEKFWKVLDDMEANAVIIKTRYGKYGMPDRMNLLPGKLSVNSKGYGFVLPEGAEEADLFIPPGAMADAMHGDRVIARVHRRQSPGKAAEGKIIRVVERANKFIVGTFEASRHFGFVLPDDRRIGMDIFIPKDEFNTAHTGSKVVAEITQWPQKQKSAAGRIVEVLGQPGEPGVEILSIIKNHNLPIDFPPEALRDADNVPAAVTAEETADRRDLRDIDIVTIDGEDAKDLDDAVHVRQLENGRYLLGVHIADVSYYVKENTPLDREAFLRGTSVYLADRVLPMLPPRLSNGICSLNAGVDRLTLSVHMEIDKRGQVADYEIFPSVINVKKRFSYDIVRKILADHDEDLRDEYRDFTSHLEEMERLCLLLRDRRMRRGAIDFDLPEIKVKLDDKGRPLEIVKQTRSIAESIIEEFMLLANETTARHLSSLGIPSVFRVHEEPDHAKLSGLNTLLHNFGQRLPHLSANSEIHPMALQKILTRIAGRPEERIISSVMLRSLKQARYDAENLGHFGLAADYYTHFTSPIRRYPDLIVHRIMRETFTGGDISSKRRQKLAVMLPEIALHSSSRERAAFEAERETIDLKKVEYMERFIGSEFPGIIVGVTAFGLFVEIENGVEGLVHVSSMDDDYYQYIEEKYALIGGRTGKTYRLGDAASVIVIRTNPSERTIDYVLAPNSVSPAEPTRKKSSGGKSKTTLPPAKPANPKKTSKLKR